MNYNLLIAPVVYVLGCLAASVILDVNGKPDHAAEMRKLLLNGLTIYGTDFLK